MSDVSGGVATAAGLGFQYLVTVEELLDRYEDSDTDFVLRTEDPRGEVVDFSFEVDGEIDLVVQAKAAVDGPDGAAMTATDLLDVAERLIAVRSHSHELRTNRRLTGGANRIVQMLRTCQDMNGPQIRSSLVGLPEKYAARLRGFDDSQLTKLAHLAVNVSKEGADDLAESLRRRLLRVRRYGDHGIGEKSSRASLFYLLAEIFYLSGRRGPREFHRAELEAILGMSDRNLAYSIGQYDWGNVFGTMPTMAAVHRPDVLNAVLCALPGPPDRRRPRQVVLWGLSGIGKSMLAADFVHLIGYRYTHILWIDASSQELISNYARTFLGLSPEVLETDARLKFLERVNSSPSTWLIVFDNAEGYGQIKDWIPPNGCVDIVATSTTSMEWNSIEQLDVPPMETAEAISMVGRRLSVDTSRRDQEDLARVLVENLGNWPLAIDLACAFLKQTGRGLTGVSRYLQILAERVLDEPALMPAGYESHPTLLQAIFVTLDYLASFEPVAGPPPTLLLDALAYLPPRSAPISLAGRVAIFVDHRHRNTAIPENDSKIDLAIDDAMRGLVSLGLLQGSTSDSALGELGRVNEVVLDIVRRLQSNTDRAINLSLLQIALSQCLLQALDDEDFRLTAALEGPCHYVLDHAEASAMVTPEGVTMIGNLAARYMQRGCHQEALKLYRTELMYLDAEDLPAPVIRAKIYASTAGILLHLNAPAGEIEEAIDGAIRVIKEVVDATPDRFNEVAIAVEQLRGIFVYARQDSLLGVPKVARWQHDLDALTLPLQSTDGWAVGWASAYAEVSRQLSDPSIDTRVVHERILQLLRNEPSAYRRVELIFELAESFALMGKYEEAMASFEEAIQFTEVNDLSLGPGWTSILNSWQAACIGLLGGVESAKNRIVCDYLDSRISETPASAEDIARLSVVRAATIVRNGALDAVTARVGKVCVGQIGETHLQPNVEATHNLAKACTDILRLRKQVDGAEVLDVQGFRRSQLSGFVLTMISIDSTLSLRLGIDLRSFRVFPGDWVLSPLGAGVLVKSSPPALMWAPIGGNWLYPELGNEAAAQRLAELAETEPLTPLNLALLTCGELATDRPLDEVLLGRAPVVALAGRRVLEQ
ncbi:hypothetical protein [Flexivirga meconopsidis]|uniref:hypothetical protein n=1 Tax=Flexivirga meconopsidis TaxID=2977121 RepID=UPI00223F9262|nr:hypothetical protein [Flexivirga meconopsidis]